ncbi:hypothetical protein LUZ61_000078 [Rhynchospora tenuis]|uniref:Uncharacterized protein n=1 Tax=Rhynchospora tenuis TaxID=198213 RepID=A0AAD6EPH4_9POAL|nr:hypothetical protein LUZ61_000078 [Rhynchospora tenuis]
MSKRPIFPITETEPQHFSDYGFDLQVCYFQVLEEARRPAKKGSHDQNRKPSLDSVHLKLQKPIFKEESRSKRSKHKHHQLRRTSVASAAGKWLQSAGSTLLFWKRSKKETYHSRSHLRRPDSASYPTCYSSSYSASGPLYMTDSYSRAETVTCRAKSGLLAAGPYFNLKELNLASGAQSGSAGAGAGAMPVYLVT